MEPNPVHQQASQRAIQDLERRIMQEPNHAQTTESMTNPSGRGGEP